MNSRLKHSLGLLISVACLAGCQAKGQTFTTLHSFATTGEGSLPVAPVILSGNVLYGTTFFGGISNEGTIFRINTDGTGFATLHHFPGGSQGGEPRGRLLLSGTTLYGTTQYGAQGGIIFTINTDGTGFTNLYSFQSYSTAPNVGGGFPTAGLIQSGNTLYGTT